MEDYYKPENLIKEHRAEFTSPLGKYKLVTNLYKSQEGWNNISLGEVFLTDNEKKLFEVKRNYPMFPYCFIENHPNGHDYLVCGEDYQGQTILELDTGKRVDYLPEGYKDGVGFCWADIRVSKEKDVLAVEGCYWACPYEEWFIDFSEPLKLPYLVLSRFPSIEDNANLKKEWSARVGVEISFSGYDQENTSKIVWKIPESINVARYWIEELSVVKKDSNKRSPYLSDTETQVKLSLSRLTKKELDLLKKDNSIPIEFIS